MGFGRVLPPPPGGLPALGSALRGSAMKRLTLLKAARLELPSPLPSACVSMNTGTFPLPFDTSHHAHFIIPAQQAQDELNKGAWVRGSLTVQTPAPRLPGRDPLEAHLQAAAEVSPFPLCASLSPLIRRGSPWLVSEGPFNFDFLPNRKPGPTSDTAN